MSEISRFFDQVEYNADEFAQYYAMFYGNGIVKSQDYPDSLSVEKQSNTSVIVNPGCAIIKGYQYINDAQLEINGLAGTGKIILRLDTKQCNIKAIAVASSGTSDDSDYDVVLCDYTVTNGILSVNCGVANYSKALFTHDYESHKQSNNEAHQSLSTRMTNAEIALGANALLKKIKSVDGSGSELDADKLDGKESSYFLDYSNFSNTPTIHSGTQEPTPDIGKDGELYILYEE